MKTKKEWMEQFSSINTAEIDGNMEECARVFDVSVPNILDQLLEYDKQKLLINNALRRAIYKLDNYIPEETPIKTFIVKTPIPLEELNKLLAKAVSTLEVTICDHSVPGHVKIVIQSKEDPLIVKSKVFSEVVWKELEYLINLNGYSVKASPEFIHSEDNTLLERFTNGKYSSIYNHYLSCFSLI